MVFSGHPVAEKRRRVLAANQYGGAAHGQAGRAEPGPHAHDMKSHSPVGT